MLKNVCILGIAFSLTVVSIYSLKIADLNDNFISLNRYTNKKILLVNIASNSNQINQLDSLQKLYNLNSDSLVIIGFPSNSFGNEPKTNAQLKTFFSNHNISFPMAGKSAVIGTGANVVYKWLSNKMQNEVLDADISSDFQKYLIDKSGKIVGIFDSSVNPLNSLITEAIRTH